MKYTAEGKIRIPNYWTADQAKAVWEFLEDIISAIWNAHFNALHQAIIKEKSLLERAPIGDEIQDILEDDLPF